MSPVVWMSPAESRLGRGGKARGSMTPSPLHLVHPDIADVEHNVDDVLAHARDGREFVQHAVDMNRGDRRATATTAAPGCFELPSV